MVDAIKLSCHINIAACQLKTKEYDEVVQHCTKALDIDPDNEKALYRRGCAHYERKLYLNAKTDLTDTLKVNPQNKSARDKLAEVEKALEERKKKQKSNMFGGLIGRLNDQNNKETQRERKAELKEEQMLNKLSERVKYIPIRLNAQERSYLHLLESGLSASDYTGRVDILSYQKKSERILEQLKKACGILSGI